MSVTKVDRIAKRPDINTAVPPSFRLIVLPIQSKALEDDENNEDMVKHTSGLYIPKAGDTAWKEKQEVLMQNSGIVISIGRTAFKAYDDGEPWCKKGDRVYFKRYCGDDIVFSDGLIYKIINDNEILLVEPKDEDKENVQ